MRFHDQRGEGDREVTGGFRNREDGVGNSDGNSTPGTDTRCRERAGLCINVYYAGVGLAKEHEHSRSKDTGKWICTQGKKDYYGASTLTE